MTNPPRPDQASADPGGRTDGLHGFKSRSEEWLRPLEPPAASGILVRHASLRPTECEFDLASNPIAKPARPRSKKNCKWPPCIVNRSRPNRTSLTACSIASRPSRCAAALRAGL